MAQMGDASLRTLLLIVGVVLIVAGVGLALTGYNQMQAAEVWDEQPHSCGWAGSFEEASEIECPKNPYAGGGLLLTLGVGFAAAGGLSVRVGSQ